MQEETHVTEDSLRKALERLGTERKERTHHAKRSSISSASIQERATYNHLSTSASINQNTSRRRRFVGDDTVTVEHNITGRSGERLSAARRSQQNVSRSADEAQEVERLKQALRKEQRRSRVVEDEVQALRAQVRTLETRSAHYQIQVSELGRQLGAQQSETLRLRVQLREVNAMPEQKGVKRRGRPRKTEKSPDMGCSAEAGSGIISDAVSHDEDPQPVQWWRD